MKMEVILVHMWENLMNVVLINNHIDMPEGGASLTLRMYRPNSLVEAKTLRKTISRIKHQIIMRNSFTLIILAIILLVGCQQKQEIKTDNQRVQVEYENNGYLKQDIIEDIRDEQLRVKAISAYEYAIPIVGIEQWHKGFLTEANYGDWVIYETRESKTPILTANTTTPYVASLVDLAEASYYIEIPAGPIGGLIEDIYQTPTSDLGILGPDKGKGGKYLLVGPEAEVPLNHDADFIVKSKSNLVFLGTRIIGLTGEAI